MMKSKVVAFLVVFIILSNVAFSQLISGKVIDAETGKPIPYVNVWYKDSSVGSFTNELGEFQLPKSDKDEVSFSCIGYKRFDHKLSEAENDLVIKLATDPIMLEDVVVESNKKWATEIIGYAKGRKFPFLGISFWDYKKQFWKVTKLNSENQKGFIKSLHLGIIDNRPKSGVLVIQLLLTEGDKNEQLLTPNAYQFKIAMEDLEDEIVFDLSRQNIPLKANMNVYLTFIGIENETSFGGGLLDVKFDRKSYQEPRIFHRSSEDATWETYPREANKYSPLNIWINADVEKIK